jgi:hypothetical protein
MGEGQSGSPDGANDGGYGDPDSMGHGSSDFGGISGNSSDSMSQASGPGTSGYSDKYGNVTVGTGQNVSERGWGDVASMVSDALSRYSTATSVMGPAGIPAMAMFDFLSFVYDHPEMGAPVGTHLADRAEIQSQANPAESKYRLQQQQNERASRQSDWMSYLESFNRFDKRRASAQTNTSLLTDEET